MPESAIRDLSSLRLAVPDIAFSKAKPACRRDFLLGEELNAFLALHVQIAKERIIPAVERKPGHRGRHAHVNTNHAALNPVFELARCFTGGREN